MGHAVGPFDESDAVHAEEFIESEIGEFLGVAETVSIAMPDRKHRRVFVDQGEGGAVNDFIRHPQGLRDGLDQSCFACPKVTDQRDDISRTQRRRERTAGDFCLRFGLPIDFPHGTLPHEQNPP